MTSQPPLYVRVCDSKKVFGLSRHTIYRAVNRGEITIHKRGVASLLSVAEVSAWIEKRP